MWNALAIPLFSAISALAAVSTTLICMTLGTGVGGGCYSGGRFFAAAHYFANALGYRDTIHRRAL